MTLPNVRPKNPLFMSRIEPCYFTVEISLHSAVTIKVHIIQYINIMIDNKASNVTVLIPKFTFLRALFGMWILHVSAMNSMHYFLTK